MKIDCLMGTYGRYSLASEALGCFLQQTALSQATLLVYNQHPVPMRFEHPRVRVVNEALPPTPLRYIRTRMLELADPAADLIHWWDDDDLYLPWHLEDCLTHIGNNVAWKPASSWFWEGTETFSRVSNRFEGSWVFRADYLKTATMESFPTFIEHPIFPCTEDAGLLTTTELAGRTSYIYRWNTGMQHVSAYGGNLSQEAQRAGIESWRRKSNDVRLRGTLVPADLALRWRQFLKGTKNLVTPEEHELNRRGCGVQDEALSTSSKTGGISSILRRWKTAFVGTEKRVTRGPSL